MGLERKKFPPQVQVSSREIVDDDPQTTQKITAPSLTTSGSCFLQRLDLPKISFLHFSWKLLENI